MLYLNSVFERFQAGHIHIIIYHQYITILKFNLNNLVQRQFLLGFVPGFWGPFETNKFLPFLPTVWATSFSLKSLTQLLVRFWAPVFRRLTLIFTSTLQQDSKLATTRRALRGTSWNMIQHDPTMGPTMGPNYPNSMGPKVTEFDIRCFSFTDPSNHSWSPWTTGRTWKRAWYTPKNVPGVWPNLLRCQKHVETS